MSTPRRTAFVLPEGVKIRSAWTAPKLEVIDAIIDYYLSVHWRMRQANRYPACALKLCDLNCGDGSGSLALLARAVDGLSTEARAALRYPPEIYACDTNLDDFAQAQARHGENERILMRQRDNTSFVQWLFSIGALYDTARGFALCDPMSAPQWSCLQFLGEHCSKLDLVIVAAAAGLKWNYSKKQNAERRDLYDLDERIPELNKRHWFVREPFSNWQWTVLVGTNWIDQRDVKRAGLISTMSDRGREIYDQLRLTEDEFKARYQAPLSFDAEDEAVA